MIKFDSGIPVPTNRMSEVAKTLAGMKLNQSFQVRFSDERKVYLMAAKRAGIKITTRKLDGKGFRIWRVK